jgi:hypothetical protein
MASAPPVPETHRRLLLPNVRPRFAFTREAAIRLMERRNPHANSAEDTGPLTAPECSVPMRAVKLSLSLLLLVSCALSLCACNTLANRRSLYSPKKGEGYWTRTLDEGTWKERGEDPADATVRRGNAPSSEAIPQPPPPPSEPAPGPAVTAPLPG